MCYNCGCKMFDDDHGEPGNITEDSFRKAAEAAGQSVKEAKEETLRALETALGNKQSSAA